MSTIRLFTTLAVTLAALPAVAAQPPVATMPFWTSGEQNVVTTGMIWRDCNGDGVIDVFYSNGNDIERAVNTIYLSDNGTLPNFASWVSANTEYSGHCAVGDIDDDGAPDFVVANFLGVGWNRMNVGDVYYNRGALPGTSPDWHTPDSMYSFSCALGDYDNDGDLDIVFATGDAYNNHYTKDILYRNDDGVFSSAAVWQSAGSNAALDVTWGDVDNDGDLDLAFTYDDRATAVYRNNNGVIETSPSWSAATSESGNTLVFGDVNCDGWLDLIVAYNNQLGGSGRFRVYFNNGSGTLNTVHGWESSNGGYGSALALYDYDHDGDDDLAAGRWWSGILIYENLGATFTAAPVWTGGISVVAEELAWVDIHGWGVAEYTDTCTVLPGRSLYYTLRHPLYAIDSVKSDGGALDRHDYCYDLVSGWVSLADAPSTDLHIYYRYSVWNDLAVANWDTLNMAFLNTNKPLVDFVPVNSFGPAPLAVTFDNTSENVDSVRWDFGDGESSTEFEPVHIYQMPGYHSVRLTAFTSAGAFVKTGGDHISAYADTLWAESVQGVAGSRVRVDVYATNYLPLSELTIPFTWTGPFNLVYDSFSTAGLRTEYLDRQTQANYDPSNKRATIRLGTATTGVQPLLDPGFDAVVSLWFSIPSGASGAANPIGLTQYAVFRPKFITYAGEYIVPTRPGAVSLGCCVGYVGNVDASADQLVTMGDLTVLIDHLFISFAPVACVAEANVDMSEDLAITMGDLTVLIDHLFVSFNPLPPCP
jgi:PKD repeat protein